MPNKGIIMLNGKQYGDTGTNYNVVKCTQQEYDALTPEQKNNGCLYIVLGSTTNSVNYLGATVAGNTNQASGVSYDDSQTQLGASNVQDAIGQINADLSASSFGTPVDIHSYVEGSSRYTAPSDGYVKWLGLNQTDPIGLYLNGTIVSHAINWAEWNCLFVRKGMKISFSTTPTSGGVFIPLV